MSCIEAIRLAAALRLLRVTLFEVISAGVLMISAGISAATPHKSAAALQLEAGEFVVAIELAERDIARFNKMHNRYDIQLAQPLRIVGDARLQLGDAAGALRAYQRATQILRVNHGLDSAAQVASLLAEVQAHIELGELIRANNRLEYAHAITVRAYGPLDARALPITVRLANWYEQHYQMDAARALFERALTLSEMRPSTTAGQQIWLLRRIASTYRATLFPTSGPTSIQPSLSCCGRQYEHNRRHGRGQSAAEDARAAAVALRRAVALTGHRRGQNTQVGGSIRTEVLLDLADWYLLLDLQPAAKRTYAALWSVLTPAERHVVFAGPVQLYTPHPGNPQPVSSVGHASEGAGEAGLIEFEIDVGPRG